MLGFDVVRFYRDRVQPDRFVVDRVSARLALAREEEVELLVRLAPLIQVRARMAVVPARFIHSLLESLLVELVPRLVVCSPRGNRRLDAVFR